MNEDILQIGVISIKSIEDEEEKSQKKEDTKLKSDIKLKIKFEGILEQITIKYKTPGDTQNNQILKQQIIYYCLYLNLEVKERGYHLEKDKLYLINKVDSTDFIIYSTKITEESIISEIIDYHFGGEGVFEIFDNYQQLKKDHSSDKFSKAILLSIVAVFAVGWMISVLFFDEEVIKQIPPPSRTPDLNTEQQLALQIIASQKIIEALEENIENIISSPLTDNGKQRITNFKFDRYSILAPVQFKKSSGASGHYFCPNKELQYGAVKLTYNKELQQSYAGVGYTLVSKNIYVKSERYSKIITPDEAIEIPDLTQSCIEETILISSKETFVFERNKGEVIFKFLNTMPSAFLPKLKRLLHQCPAYLEDVSVSNGKFNGRLILFAKERIQ